MKHIACIAHGPGSANALFPLIEKLKENNQYHVHLYALHPYVANLWGVDVTTEQAYERIFDRSYDLIMYGTGSGSYMERHVPLLAKRKGSPTVSILDIYWMSDDNLRFRYEHAPVHVIVPTHEVKNRMEQLGIMKKESIHALGNPHFDRLKQYQNTQSMALPPYNVVVFSQPSGTEGLSPTAEKIQALLYDLVHIKETANLIKQLTVTPHPRESLEWLERFTQTYAIKLETIRPSFDLLLEMDVNIGVDCTLQYESLLIQKPTIFYQHSDSLLTSLKNLPNENLTHASIDFQASEQVCAFIDTFLGF